MCDPLANRPHTNELPKKDKCYIAIQVYGNRTPHFIQAKYIVIRQSIINLAERLEIVFNLGFVFFLLSQDYHQIV